MARTRRAAIDELGGYDQLGLDGPTPPEDDFYQFSDSPGTLAIWGIGLVSFGPATDAQIAFMANLGTSTDLSAFPGDFVAIGFSAA